MVNTINFVYHQGTLICNGIDVNILARTFWRFVDASLTFTFIAIQKDYNFHNEPIQ